MKILKILGLVFFLIGLTLLIAGFLSYFSTQKFITHSTVTTGTVIDLVRGTSGTDDSATSSYVYYPVVQYETINGVVIEFHSRIGSNPPSYRKGDQVRVRYPEKDPYKARIDSFMQIWFVSIILGCLGIVFGGIGGTMLGLVLRSNRQEKWLLENGQIIFTDYDSVILDTSIRLKGQNPYRILSQWLNPQNNTVYIFKSKPILYNPEKYVKSKAIQVRINPDNPKQYLMDTSYLPKSVS
ncbi:DUF3592 domain-containing protein [candidate division KSB1 bacterium]|nr:DUF3592 domain-containing protein [candidate division KSB1 bacterium]